MARNETLDLISTLQEVPPNDMVIDRECLWFWIAVYAGGKLIGHSREKIKTTMAEAVN